MKFSATLLCALLLLGGLAFSGCFPASQGQSDEEKEPHFLAGNSWVNARDYTRAIESFEKALEVNPKSAAAHFELAWIFDQKEVDPAAAIYHYERYLRLRRDAKNIDVVKGRVLALKGDLARTVSLGPVTEKQQRDLEKTVEENKRLNEENKRLNEELARWRASAVSPVAGGRSQSLALAPGATFSATNGGARVAAPPAKTNVVAQGVGQASPKRTYTVKAGDTPTSIARQFGVKLDALTAANPRLDARRMKAGQVINLP